MRITRFGALSVCVATFLFTLTLAGCGGGGGNKDMSTTDGTTSGKDKDKDSGATKTKTALKPGKGTFKGKVTLVGGKPDIAELNKKLEEAMKTKPADLGTCHDKAPEDQKTEQEWKIADDGSLKDVFVYLKPVSGTYFAFEDNDDMVKAAKEKAHFPSVDQPHCAFIPHAMTAFAGYRTPASATKKPTSTGQKLIINNSSMIAHNTKYGEFNQSVPAGAKDKEAELVVGDKPVKVGCDVHPWMNAYVLALDHPYAAVTNEKGEFEIKNVPAGKVMVIVYHPQAEYDSAGGAKGQEIELKDGDNAPKNFEIKYKP
jgi:hypothetical protein